MKLSKVVLHRMSIFCRFAGTSISTDKCHIFFEKKSFLFCFLQQLYVVLGFNCFVLNNVNFTYFHIRIFKNALQ